MMFSIVYDDNGKNVRTLGFNADTEDKSAPLFQHNNYHVYSGCYYY